MDKPSRFRTKQLPPDAMADLEAVLDGLLDRLIIEIGPDAGDADAQLRAALGAALFSLVSRAQDRATALPGADCVKATFATADTAAWVAGAALWPLMRLDCAQALARLGESTSEGLAHGQEIIQFRVNGASK